MAIQKRIKAVIQFRRGNASEWKAVNPILRQGEPGFEIDTGRVKIGNNITPWNELDYITGDTSIYIEDPVDKQVLLYNAETERWENFQLTDENSIVYLDENGLSLKGYEDAIQGQMLVKDEVEGLAWVNPVSDASLQDAVRAAQDSATRAGSSATTAGNFAGEAIQAAAQVEGKFWYGTMEEYNNLETVNPSSIYIILHE